MGFDPPLIRKVRVDELPALLGLYRHLHPSDPELPISSELERHWQSICANPQLHYFGAEIAGTLVSSCTLTIIPNLTRAARPYGLIENVVTDPEFRGRGIATSILKFALRFAWEQGCYKVMLLTSRKEPEVLRFYERAGFKAGVKTGFVATP